MFYPVLIVALFLTVLWSAIAVFVDVTQMQTVFHNCLWAIVALFGVVVGVVVSVVVGAVAIKGVMMTG